MESWWFYVVLQCFAESLRLGIAAYGLWILDVGIFGPILAGRTLEIPWNLFASAQGYDNQKHRSQKIQKVQAWWWRRGQCIRRMDFCIIFSCLMGVKLHTYATWRFPGPDAPCNNKQHVRNVHEDSPIVRVRVGSSSCRLRPAGWREEKEEEGPLEDQS